MFILIAPNVVLESVVSPQREERKADILLQVFRMSSVCFEAALSMSCHGLPTHVKKIPGVLRIA
jgi:hypothetical protein